MPFLPEELLHEASAVAGLEDFGSPDFRDGLDALCASLDAEADLNDLGQAALRGNIVGNLVRRLRVINFAHAHASALLDEQIVAPIVVVGHFRAGTTFLSYLLDQDPVNRALLRWESSDPVPPSTPETFRAGPRVDAARAGAEMMDAINPRFKAIHHEEADGPTECVSVISADFKSLLWETMANVPSYSSWLLGVDQHSAYRYHHTVLRILQSGGVRGRWTLKSPHHALALEPLTAEFPDARLIVLHRDPAVLCASVCSLISTLSGSFTDTDHGAYIATHWTNMLEESVRRVDAFREAHPHVPLVDVHYADLVRDPIRTIERLYDATGSSLSDDARARMQHYVATHPKGRFGAHRYELASMRLDAAEIEQRFSGYVDRYGVERERESR